MRLVLVIPPCGAHAHAQRVALGHAPVELGGGADCDGVVDHPSVGAARVRLEPRGDGWVAVDREGHGACAIGGVPLRARVPRIVLPSHTLRLGDVDIELTLDPSGDAGADTREIALRAVAVAASVTVPRVRVVEGPGAGLSAELHPGRVVRIGRAAGSDLLLDDDRASREHLTVELTGGRVVVRDLGSARGTYLGRSRLAPRRGAVWDTRRLLEVGATVLSLEVPAVSDEADWGRVVARVSGDLEAPTDGGGAPAPPEGAPGSDIVCGTEDGAAPDVTDRAEAAPARLSVVGPPAARVAGAAGLSLRWTSRRDGRWPRAGALFVVLVALVALVAVAFIIAVLAS